MVLLMKESTRMLRVKRRNVHFLRRLVVDEGMREIVLSFLLAAVLVVCVFRIASCCEKQYVWPKEVLERNK